MDYILTELNVVYILPSTSYHFKFILLLSFYVGLWKRFPCRMSY